MAKTTFTKKEVMTMASCMLTIFLECVHAEEKTDQDEEELYLLGGVLNKLDSLLGKGDE